jgi:hypothetical protein
MIYLMFASEAEALEHVGSPARNGREVSAGSDADAIDVARSDGWEVVLADLGEDRYRLVWLRSTDEEEN